MLEGINFSYAGEYSTDMGLLNCKLDGGMFEETFLPTRKIQEVKVTGNHNPYFQSIELEPLKFDLTFAFEYYYDEQKIREVARWLMQDYYKPFYTIDNPSRIYYCMIDGDSKLVHNGLKQGYITLTMRCDSPFSYSQEYTRDNIMFKSSKNVLTFEEDIYNANMGVSQSNVFINSKSNMEIMNASVTWNSLSGKKWSDL